MISRGSVKEPKPAPIAKFDKYSGIAPGNGVRDDSHGQVQRHVVHAEPSHKIVDVTNVFLVGFGGKNSLEEPSAIMDLLNMAHFLKCCYGPAHDWNFFWSVVNLLHSDGSGVAGINDTFVVANRNKDAALIEDRPVLDHKHVSLVMQHLVRMGQVELLVQPLAVLRLVILKREEGICRIIGIERRMLQFTEDWAAVDIMYQRVKIIGDIRETAVIDENVLHLTLPLSHVHMNGRWRWRVRC